MQVNWLDYLLLFVLFTGIYRGFKTGFILSCIRLAGIVVSFLVATNYYRAAGSLIEQKWHIADLLSVWLAKHYQPIIAHTGLHSHATEFPVMNDGALVQLASIHTATGSQDPVYYIACGLLNAASFVVLFSICERLLFFIGSQVTFFRRWLIFMPFDRVGGMLLGAIWGLVGGVALFLILHHAASLYGFMAGPTNFLSQSLETASLAPYYDGLLRVVGAFLPQIDWRSLTS